jgi:hypothetical protein
MSLYSWLFQLEKLLSTDLPTLNRSRSSFGKIWAWKVCGGGTTILHSIYQKIIRVENSKLMTISQHLHNVNKELKV